MYFRLFNIIVIVAFFGWIGHSMLMIAKLFSTIECTDKVCYRTLLSNKPRLQLALFTSSLSNPIAAEVTKLDNIEDFDYWQNFQKEYDLKLPMKTKRNGTMYLHIILAESGASLEWNTLRRDGPTVIHTMRITEYIEPKAQSFNLLKSKATENNKDAKDVKPAKSISEKPVTHLMKHIYVVLLVEDFTLSVQDVPPEMSQLIRVNQRKQIMPIMKTDFFNNRLNDLELVNRNMSKFSVTFHYNTIGVGKLRLMIILEQAMRRLEEMGFGKQNIEDVKALMSDTNLYLLLLTISVASIHMLFDFLSLKNDVCFWRQKESYAGLSTRTTLWRAFSQIIIFLYLMEENTSVLVLVPAGLGTLIEMWKCKKILKLNVSLCGIRRRPSPANTRLSRKHSSDEEKTEEFDKQGMRYLSYLLYPLCISGAVYSLIYQPHRSWYSWTLHSMVNGVYAFGFLFMLPQLFVNYKLKSVAALPWRAFMYKAFNTFIDDFFAFIITMPTAHRVACLRDDVVFIIYLYQRWLYPVDKNRLDTGASATITYSDADSAEMLDVNRIEILKATKQKKLN